MVDARSPFEKNSLVDLLPLVARGSALVSIDADFFIREDERPVGVEIEAWLRAKVAEGIRVTCREDHVALVDLLAEPVDVVLNFDTHMDLSLGFLFGDAPRHPPEDASVFETILTSGLTERYVWAYPSSRGLDAAHVYAAALIADGQPILHRIHCLRAMVALRLLESLRTEWVFVCRSPGYATPETEMAFRRMRSIAKGRFSSRRET